MVKFTTTQPVAATAIFFSKFGLQGMSLDTQRKSIKCLHKIRTEIEPTEEALQSKSQELTILNNQLKGNVPVTVEFMAQVTAATEEMTKGNKLPIEVEAMAEGVNAFIEVLKKIDWSSAELKDKFEGVQMINVEQMICDLESAKEAV